MNRLIERRLENAYRRLERKTFRPVWGWAHLAAWACEHGKPQMEKHLVRTWVVLQVTVGVGMFAGALLWQPAWLGLGTVALLLVALLLMGSAYHLALGGAYPLLKVLLAGADRWGGKGADHAEIRQLKALLMSDERLQTICTRWLALNGTGSLNTRQYAEASAMARRKADWLYRQAHAREAHAPLEEAFQLLSKAHRLGKQIDLKSTLPPSPADRPSPRL